MILMDYPNIHRETRLLSAKSSFRANRDSSKQPPTTSIHLIHSLLLYPIRHPITPHAKKLAATKITRTPEQGIVAY